MEKLETLDTASPAIVTTIYSVPETVPVTVPLTCCGSGVLAMGLAAVNVSELVLTEKVAAGVVDAPSEPPPQADNKIASPITIHFSIIDSLFTILRSSLCKY
jgi:hypothetical protein